MEEKITLDDLAFNLRQARMKGYAGGGKYEKLLNGYQKGFRHGSQFSYFYKDLYRPLVTPESFAGEEYEFYKDRLAWRMIYSDGMIPPYHLDSKLVQKVIKLLRFCLMTELKLEKDPMTNFRPRGPIELRASSGFSVTEGLVYQCQGKLKDIRNFWGCEWISKNNIVVYRGTFSGGTVNERLFKD